MNRNDLAFPRPARLEASAPPEARGVPRDHVRLLATGSGGVHEDARFTDLPRLLAPGDLLVVNDSATLPASLPATAPGVGAFRLHLSTRYGPRLWLAEPRWSAARPGPLPLHAGDEASLPREVRVRLLHPYPGLPRLWFVEASAPLEPVMAAVGAPIRYGHLSRPRPLPDHQTLFARRPGSAEMPSAARPFTPRVVRALGARGVRFASVTLHAGVSSLEVEGEDVAAEPVAPEPFRVGAAAARAVNATRAAGGRVVAVGTTVVRALETAWTGAAVAPARGFTRVLVHPGRGVHAVDGLVTGFHDPVTTHVALLAAVAGMERVRDAYAHAVSEEYLWHEFGDSHLILREGARQGPGGDHL